MPLNAVFGIRYGPIQICVFLKIPHLQMISIANYKERMKQLRFLLSVLFLGSLFSCDMQTSALTVTSPDTSNTVNFILSEDGRPGYLVLHDQETVIDTSYMSFEFKDSQNLQENFEILSTASSTTDETWDMPWVRGRTCSCWPIPIMKMILQRVDPYLLIVMSADSICPVLQAL